MKISECDEEDVWLPYASLMHRGDNSTASMQGKYVICLLNSSYVLHLQLENAIEELRFLLHLVKNLNR